jgi:hypothetical protein
MKVRLIGSACVFLLGLAIAVIGRKAELGSAIMAAVIVAGGGWLVGTALRGKID